MFQKSRIWVDVTIDSEFRVNVCLTFIFLYPQLKKKKFFLENVEEIILQQ